MTRPFTNYRVEANGHSYRVTIARAGLCLGVWRKLKSGREAFVHPEGRTGRKLVAMAREIAT